MNYDNDQCFQEAISLFRLLILEGYSLETIKGLRTLADALIEKSGFEERFSNLVQEAVTFIDEAQEEREQIDPMDEADRKIMEEK